MQFLSDLFVRCAECEGKRFQPHVLRVHLYGKSIHDVLQLTVSQAIQFFAQIGESAKLGDPLDVLDEVGLGYLRLGQPLNTLSGGESQRLKLVGHLADHVTGENGNHSLGKLFIFDEPTTGLHFDDVAMLVQVFQGLVKRGNSIVVIEHNLEVIKCADWVIDLGPEAGDDGGELVGVGTPEAIAKIDASHTGQFLRPLLSAQKKIIPFATRYDLTDEDQIARAAETAPRFHLNGNGSRAIQIHGAREHNLKNISLGIPRDKMVIITGLSGSGKSTVAFDILFSEGQRRFLDSMSPYARQFVEQLEKPDVDLVEGVPPSVAIEQL
jgi:excinuclease ABC subunit A